LKNSRFFLEKPQMLNMHRKHINTVRKRLQYGYKTVRKLWEKEDAEDHEKRILLFASIGGTKKTKINNRDENG